MSMWSSEESRSFLSEGVGGGPRQLANAIREWTVSNFGKEKPEIPIFK